MCKTAMGVAEDASMRTGGWPGAGSLVRVDQAAGASGWLTLRTPNAHSAW